MLIFQNYADQKFTEALGFLASGSRSIQERARSAVAHLGPLNDKQLPPHLAPQLEKIRSLDWDDASQAEEISDIIVKVAREVPSWRQTKTGWEPGLWNLPTAQGEE